ncbi:MAG TPA: pyridoxal-dependent decarboxylase [Candidatus Polarisedimenticolaceae bacterium]|nr:pyridoxal-dependent decarboxylase [Candidatus Polarisedimenticolaceae bacterium]
MPKPLGDMSPDEFRAAARRVADLAADYLDRLDAYDVLPRIEPGATRAKLPPQPPSAPEPLSAILDDYRTIVEPFITHWQHPMFMAYFPSVASGPGILGEWLAATLNSNVMLWRNAPSSTELEELVVSWLRQMLGLPEAFDGMLTDTASISSLLSIVAARHAVPGLRIREEGLSGRRLRMYASTEAHSSIEKAAIVAGIGRAGIRRIEVDAEFRMRPEALSAAIAEDRAAGWVPFCVVATLGTTSSTSIDPCEALASVCAQERIWLHVDAAYGGVAAVVPEMRGLFAGWERADSIVVNPHKWMFTPFDASLLLFRDPENFRDAFSLVPEYLKTREAAGVHNFNEYGIQLGRRFRALKLWMQIRWFGVDGIAARLRDHVRLARLFASWVDADPDWERVAPVPLATVCFRYRRGEDPDARNREILDRVNATGRVFLSHTKLDGRFVLRVAIGNPRQTDEHVARCWALLKEAAVT